MSAQVIVYHDRRRRPVVDWNWMVCEAEPKTAEVRVMGTVAAGEPIEALPCPQCPFPRK